MKGSFEESEYYMESERTSSSFQISKYRMSTLGWLHVLFPCDVVALLRQSPLRKDIMKGNSIQDIWLDDTAYKIPSNCEILPF